MKNFDFFGQMVLITFGLILLIPFEEMLMLFAGLVMFAIGVWQLLSTIFNLLNESSVQKRFFKHNLIIAIGYIIVATLFWNIFEIGRMYKYENTAWYIMMGIPPLLIIRYWIGISKIYNVGFFKKKTTDGQS